MMSELVENNPEPEILIKAGAPLLYCGDLNAETARLGLLGGDGKEHDQVAIGSF